jgi:hypothetical protein
MSNITVSGELLNKKPLWDGEAFDVFVNVF